MTGKSRRKKTNNLPRILILGGVTALAAVVLLLKVSSKNQEKAQTAAVSSILPADQLQNALTEGRPTLAFFHSNSCNQCIKMIKIVDQVYPEFGGSIILVDVNIYDERFCVKWDCNTSPP